MTVRDEWRWTDDRGVQRLVGTEELRAALADSVLPLSTLVWQEGMKEWAPASTIPELMGATPMAAPRPMRLKGIPLTARGTVPTLVGMPTPDSQRHGPPLSVPIVVPSPGGMPEPGRAVITQPPLYAGTQTEADGSSPDIPRAPRVPAPSALKERPKPPRKVTTSEIDGLWATPSTDTDDDYTLSLERGSEVRSTSKPIPVKGADVKPAPPPAENETPRPAAAPTPPAKKPATSDPDDDVTLLKPPTGAAEEQATAGEPSPATKITANASATSKEEPVDKPGASPATKAAAEALPDSPSGAADAPTAAAEALARSSSPPAGAPGKGGSHRAPPPPPPRPITKPPSKLPPPLRPKPRPPGSQAPEAILPVKIGQFPPPPRLSESTRPPKPAAREEAIELVPVLELPAEEAFVAAVTDIEASKPTAPLSPAAADPLSLPTTAAPPAPTPPSVELAADLTSPPAAIASGAASIDNEGAPRAKSAAPAAGSQPLSRPPRRAPTPSSPSLKETPRSRPPLDSAAHASRHPYASVARDNTAEPAKPLDQPVSVPVSSLLGAGGALIFMVISAFFVGRCSAKTPPLMARSAFQAVPAIARALVPTPPKPCWVVRQPVMWAPKVSKNIPFDVVATAEGSLAVGYARNAGEALGIEVSPATGQVQPRYQQRFNGEIERVMPMPSHAEFHVITTDTGGALTSVIPVPLESPFFVGIQGASLAVAARLDSAPAALWPLSGTEGISAARVQIAGARGYGLIFRREGAIWSGWIGADQKPIGELTKVPGSGGAVGKPNSGWNRREFAVIFADRPEGSEQWEIRVGHAPTGQIPTATTVIPLPKGGPGGDAFAPDIAGLPDGRWLLVWTEGASGSRAIRAQTFTPDFTPLGDPIALSPPAGNFGQGVLGVVENYAGAVFLSKGASSYELWGSILQCG